MLDIIVTHYKEPWETGEKFFSMQGQQRGINFNDIRVILVQDGDEGMLPEEYFSGRPYRVDQICIEHAGVSAARNAGQKYATAEWVNFCDFDDTYTNIYALRNVLSILPAPAYDLLWVDGVSENLSGDSIALYPMNENYVFIHGKYIRREFLIKNNLWFDTEIWYCEDSEWCGILDTFVEKNRRGQIKAQGPQYAWCYTPNSVTTTPGRRDEMKVCAYIRDKKVCEAFRERMPYDRFCTMVSRVVSNAYYSLNVAKVPQVQEPVLEDFKQFWKEHKKYFYDAPKEYAALAQEASRKEHIAYKQKNEDISMEEWLRQQDEKE